MPSGGASAETEIGATMIGTGPGGGHGGANGKGREKEKEKGRRRFTVDALFADGRPRAVGVEDLATAKAIRLDRIEPDPAQPRQSFDPERLAELADSIRQDGVLQPIAVRYDGERDVYVILHGERRWRAAREAGLAAIPAVVREVPAERRLIQQLVENVVREDLNAVDRAAALRGIKAQLGDAPWEAVAGAVGIRRSRLFQLLGTEKLPEAAREDIRAGRLSEKQSRALQGLPAEHQEALRVAIVDGEVGAEEALRLARELREMAPLGGGDGVPAATVLADLRLGRGVAGAAARGGADDPLDALLAGLTAAGSAGSAESAGAGKRARAELARVADEVGAPAYDGERLRREILALAGTLARVPAGELRPGGGAYGPVTALAGALDALLG